MEFPSKCTTAVAFNWHICVDMRVWQYSTGETHIRIMNWIKREFQMKSLFQKGNQKTMRLIMKMIVIIVGRCLCAIIMFRELVWALHRIMNCMVFEICGPFALGQRFIRFWISHDKHAHFNSSNNHCNDYAINWITFGLFLYIHCAYLCFVVYHKILSFIRMKCASYTYFDWLVFTCSLATKCRIFFIYVYDTHTLTNILTIAPKERQLLII